ncbi:MAG: hypothetical protein ACI915_004045 [Gammaproteobacteria bacterium]|jgi:hypothetical protein
MDKLIRWGTWYRRQHKGQSFPSETVIYRAMAGQIQSGLAWRPGGFDKDDSAIDMDRKVAALPEKMQRALIAEFVLGGEVAAKTAAANMPISTYYRHVKPALARMSASER